MLYTLEVCLVLRRFVKVRMRPLDLFLDTPSDRDICNRAPADGPLYHLHALSAQMGDTVAVYHSVTLLMMGLQTPD